jgi:hypothetical protein
VVLADKLNAKPAIRARQGIVAGIEMRGSFEKGISSLEI